MRAGKRQLEQWHQYREAADADFLDVLSALHQMSRPWDQIYTHQMAFRLTGALQFGADSYTPGRVEAPVDISLGAMLALDDFFVRLACHGGFFSSGLDGPWWSGCQCFWAGRGNDCLPFTRYYDYQLRINAGAIWQTWLSGYFFGIPLDKGRQALARFMFHVGVLWLMMHEEGHYCEGHLFYRRELMGAFRPGSRVSEVGGMTGPGQDLMVEKVMEWQADRSATRAVIDVVHASELLAMLPRCCPRDALTLRRLILTAIGCVVLVMDKARQIYGQSATYPTLRTRLLGVILTAIAHGLDRGREYFPRESPSVMLAHWMQAVALSLLDLRVAAHVLQADSDLPDYKLGVETMPPLYDTALLKDADFQAAWTAVTLLAQGEVTGPQREQHLRDMTDSSALDLLHASSALSGHPHVTYPGPGIRALTASFDRWWYELHLIIDRHDNDVYDLLGPFRAAVVTSAGGIR